jgi:DNA polymerase-3 subunit epsilon
VYRDTEYAIIDLETTGFSPKHHHRIIEVGVVRADWRGNVLFEYGTLVNPQRDVGATDVHGITAQDVADAPLFADVVGDVQNALRGAVVVAHNALFDLRFLCHECLQADAPLPDILSLCTLSLARMVAPALPCRKLGVLCDHFGVPLEHAHCALDDARATATLLAVMLGTLGEPAGKVQWDELGARLIASEFRSWPEIAPSGRQFQRSDAAARRREASKGLVALFSRLPAHNDTYNCTDEYLAVLERALEDREISEEEVESLGSIAHELDMDVDEVGDAHRRFLRDLVQAAWADGGLTEAERRDIDGVACLLGIDECEYVGMINDVMAGSLPGVPSSSHCTEDMTGCSVCFTGASNTVIDGEPVSRSRLEEIAAGNGLVVKKSVTKSLDFLVCADPKSMSGKAKKAREYGIRMMAEQAFLRKLGIC